MISRGESVATPTIPATSTAATPKVESATAPWRKKTSSIPDPRSEASELDTGSDGFPKMAFSAPLLDLQITRKNLGAAHPRDEKR
jgi:hypothetical protein